MVMMNKPDFAGARLIMVLLSLVGVAGCTQRTGASEDRMAAGIVAQNQALADPRFSEIVREADNRRRAAGARGLIVNLAQCSPWQSLRAEQPALEWLLDQFKRQGGYLREDIGFYRPKWRFSRAVARTSAPCATAVEFNEYKLADPAAIANTLVHERVHRFGHGHMRNNKRPDNACDAAYVAGDAAEALLVHKGRITDYRFEPMCKSLCEALAGRGIKHGCRVADGVMLGVE